MVARNNNITSLLILVDWLGAIRDRGEQLGNLDMGLVDQARAEIAELVEVEVEEVDEQDLVDETCVHCGERCGDQCHESLRELDIDNRIDMLRDEEFE